MERALETLWVTREVTQRGRGARAHVTPSPGRKPRGPSTRHCRQPAESHGGRASGPWRLPVASPPPPCPWDPATALGKQLRKSSGNTNPPPQSLPLLWARPLPPSAPRNGAQPKRPASPARFALARPSGHGPRPWGSQHPGLSTHLVAQRLAVPRRTRGIELEPPPSLLATFRLWDVGPRKFQA